MIKKIPVLDLKDGVAVSGKSGQRENYAPLKTVYASSANPVEIANSLKINGAEEIYIADLDLIDSNGHNVSEINMVNNIIPVILDGGVKDFESFSFFLDYAYKVIVPTETIEDLDELYRIFEAYPKERIVISVDIKNDEIYSKKLDIDMEDMKRVLRVLDPNEIILLDITGVGTEKGVNRKLLEEFAEFKDKLIMAGGLNKDSLAELEEEGIKKVLIGTALHSGEIPIL